MGKYKRYKRYKRNHNSRKIKRYASLVIGVFLVICFINIGAVKDSRSSFTPSPDEVNNSTSFFALSPDKIKDELNTLSKEYPAVEFILENISSYPDEILEMVLKNPETIDYAIDYPGNYPLMGSGHDINISGDYITGQIPLFLQFDKRWGYYNYGRDAMAINGCGPTALSMVIVGLTGDTTQNPKVVADFSYEHGYLEGAGSSWTLMSIGANYFGLSAEELSLSETAILSSLKNGKPIIASMGPGDFTTTGHYIVLTGVTDQGKILVNDSNSTKRSNMEWDIDVFMKGQTRNLWVFSRS